MADKPLGWAAFLLSRKILGAGVVKPDRVGFFYCRLSTFRFLEIPDDAIVTGGYETQVADSKPKDKTLADGTVMGGTDTSTKGTPRIINPRRKPGGKTIRLVTAKKSTNGNFKTISFNFPGWANNSTISEALGEIIPANKIEVSPDVGSEKIFAYAVSPAGGRIPIMAKTQATSQTNVQAPITKAAKDALLSSQNLQPVDGAGDTP